MNKLDFYMAMIHNVNNSFELIERNNFKFNDGKGGIYGQYK